MSETTERERTRHPVVAAALGVLVPGLGHAYIRARIRGLLWAALFLVSLVVLAPAGSLADPISTDLLGDLYTESPDMVLFLFAVWIMNAIDAYLTANRQRQDTREANACPHCGEPVDDDLEFCHWCTTRLDTPESEND